MSRIPPNDTNLDTFMNYIDDAWQARTDPTAILKGCKKLVDEVRRLRSAHPPHHRSVPETDADKLRFLADWFDARDALAIKTGIEERVLVEDYIPPADFSAVQNDLRRIADRIIYLELIESALSEIQETRPDRVVDYSADQ